MLLSGITILVACGGWAIIIDWRLGLVSIALLPALVVGMMFQVFQSSLMFQVFQLAPLVVTDDVSNFINLTLLFQIKLMMFDGAVQKGALEVNIQPPRKAPPLHEMPSYSVTVKACRERASMLFRQSATSELLSGSGLFDDKHP